jgi:L-galactono-1,4-lactone dehydrogenase
VACLQFSVQHKEYRSDEILGFACGGHQWVFEKCFLTGTLAKPSMKELDYIDKLMRLIEKEQIPWTY